MIRIDEASAYMIASKMVRLASDCFKAQDDALNDEGFSLLSSARNLVKETVLSLELEERSLNAKSNAESELTP